MVMKKLNKIEINLNRLMSTEDLMVLRGGVRKKPGDSGCCKCTDGITMVAASNEECQNNCVAYGQQGIWSC